MAECPICGKPASGAVKPFCSERCADIDLGRWLKGGYAIPGPPAGPEVPDREGENAGEGDEP